jgi:hypothetical protein
MLYSHCYGPCDKLTAPCEFHKREWIRNVHHKFVNETAYLTVNSAVVNETGMLSKGMNAIKYDNPMIDDYIVYAAANVIEK